jgi:nicotinamidase-related amidase
MSQDQSKKGASRASERSTYLSKNDYALGFPPGHTALLVIDPVNDFLSEGGAAWDLTKNTLKLHDVVGNLRRAIDGAREKGVPVIFGPMAYTEEDYADEELQRRTGINRIMFERKMFLAGSWGADFHPDLQPLDDEIILLPHKGTDVLETDLPDHLKRLGITHLVIAGMTANLCCGSTGRRAAEMGYDVTYLFDAIGSENVPSYEASVNLDFPLVGNSVIKVDDFLVALSGAPAGQIEPGDTVRGSDHMEIGTIKEVVAADAETEAHIVVPRGMIFSSDTYIPLDAVVRRAGDQVFVNVPKLVVGEMPWDKPPTKTERNEKNGLPAKSVEKLYRSRSPSAHDRNTAGGTES